MVRTGCSDDGPAALHDVERDAQPGERRRDVREQDRRVHAQAADGLERDLGAEGASRVISMRVARSRILRYSGSARPAWRMNQTGRRVHGQAASGAQEAGVGAGRGDRRVPLRARRRSCRERRRGRRDASRRSPPSPCGERDEPGLELGRRQEHARVQHRAEEAGVGVAVGGRRPRPSCAATAGRKNDREQRARPGRWRPRARRGGGLGEARFERGARRLEARRRRPA